MNTFVPASRRLWLHVATALILGFLVVPVLIVIPMSFSDTHYLDFPPSAWSLRWYRRLFASVEWYTALIVSLKLSLATALVATPLGVAAAYAIHVGERAFFRRLETFLLLPLMVPHIILAIGIFYVYVRFQVLGWFAGIVLADAMLALPFVTITALSGLRSFDMTQEKVARSLGCTRLGAFLRVTLPQIRGSVFAGALFAFVTALDEVVIALFIATGDNQTITKVMFASLRDEIDPTIAAVSTLLIVGSLIAGAAAMLLAQVGGRPQFR